MDERIRQDLADTEHPLPSAPAENAQVQEESPEQSAVASDTTDSPLVSVVVPLYNMEEFVAEALHSILASTYPHLEVIVVDDGSTDQSPRIVEEIAQQDARVRLMRQENAGPCRARNRAVAASHGLYVLPVDADNRLAPQFIAQAVEVLQAQPSVKVVRPTIEFIGDREGIWKLREFSLSKLAQRNHIDTCALYRRRDFDRIGGYCEEIIAREDWDFWIALLKDGGEVMRLSEVGYYYRVRAQSKRIRDRKLKAHVTRTLNRRHAAFFEKQLGGPLRRMRSWSRWINFLTRPCRYRKIVVSPQASVAATRLVEELPWRFSSEGTEIFKNRNAIRQYALGDTAVVVKEFTLPIRFNRFVYRWFRKTKAQRSYEYATRLRALGVGSPEPLGFCDTGGFFLIGHCYYASRASELRYNFRHAVEEYQPDEAEILRAIARTTARMHEGGFWHKDYSGGNILWDRKDGQIAVEIIDLNRMRLGEVSLELGCAAFDRLETSAVQQRIMAEAYAEVRGFDVEACFQSIAAAREKRLAK